MNLNIKHPKYYKELRKRNKSDQAISESKTVDIGDSVRPGPGLKLQAASSKQQAIEETVPHNDIEEASSDKPQANEELEGLKKYVREKKKSI